MDYVEDIDVESMDKVSETLQEETNKVFLKRSGLNGPEAVTSQAMTCLQDNKQGSKLRPTPFTTLDEDAYYGDNSAGNLQIWIIVQSH